MSQALILLLVFLLAFGACCVGEDEEEDEDWYHEPDEESIPDEPHRLPDIRTRVIDLVVGEVVTIVFSQPIHPDGVDGRIRLEGGDGAEIPVTIEVFDNDVVLTPAAPIVPGDTCTVEVDRKTRDYRWRKLEKRFRETFVVPPGVPLLVLPMIGPPIVLPPAAFRGDNDGE